MKQGTLWITDTIMYVVWDDTMCCPEPFPLISKHRKNPFQSKYVTIPIQYENQCYTIYHRSWNISDYYWAGVGSIKVNKNDIRTNTKQTTQLCKVLTGQIEPPIEIVSPESKIVRIEDTKKEDRTLKTKWDTIYGVLRTQEGIIISIPNYIHWKRCISLKTDAELTVDVRWNGLVKKYQVITISRIKNV